MVFNNLQNDTNTTSTPWDHHQRNMQQLQKKGELRSISLFQILYPLRNNLIHRNQPQIDSKDINKLSLRNCIVSSLANIPTIEIQIQLIMGMLVFNPLTKNFFHTIISPKLKASQTKIQKFSTILEIHKKMVNRFTPSFAQKTNIWTFPSSLKQIILSKKTIFKFQPHETLGFEGNAISTVF